MSILFAGSGLADFTGATGVATTSNLGAGAQEGVLLGDYGQVVQDLNTGVSTLWGRFAQVYNASTNITNVGAASVVTNWVFRIFSTSYSRSNALFQLRRYNNTNQYLRAEYWNGSAYVTIGTDLNIGSVSNSVEYVHDFQLIMHGSTGRFKIWRDDVLIFDTGDMNTVQTAATTVDRVSFNNPINNNAAASGLTISSVILASEDTRDLIPVGLYANGNGASTDWSGDYQDIDEKDLGADFISSTAANDDELHTKEAVPAAFVGQRVRAVVHAMRARNGSTGPQNLRSLMRVSGVKYASTDLAITSGMGPVQYVWDTNPADGLTWSQADLNSSQFGVRSRT